jgi:glycosyltransferase involved in cell wall biosynthesis
VTGWTIVASGLQDFGGHNFTYTDNVRSALAARGVATRVLGNAGMEEAFAREHEFERTFSRGAYDFPKPGTMSALRRWRDWSVTFENELTPLIDKQLDGVFSHTLGEFELLAWTRMARELGASTQLVLLLRMTPGYATLPAWKRRFHPFFRHLPACLGSIHRILDRRFRVVTDSEELTADLSVVYAGSIETFPIPIDPEVLRFSRIDSKWASDRLTLGFMGDGRGAKGFPLLTHLVAPLRERPGIRLLSQCAAPASNDGDFERAAATLRQAAPNPVALAEGRLSRREYAELLAAMDIVLVPYSAPGYKRSTSGIFAEALAAGKPVVVPSETWMAAELGRGLGAGEIYPRDRPEEFANACLRAAEGFEALKARAVERASEYRKHHSAATLVGQLLAA